MCAPSSHVRYGLNPGDVLTSMNVRKFDQLSTAKVAASRQARTGPAVVFELSHGDGGGVDVREEEVLGRAEGERLDDADRQEAVGHRTQRIRQRVLKFAVAAVVRSICCRAVQVSHRHVWCRGVGGARSEPITPPTFVLTHFSTQLSASFWKADERLHIQPCLLLCGF